MKFTTHGLYPISNNIAYFIELSDCGGSARLLVDDSATDYFEIEYLFDEDFGGTIAVIDPDGYSVPMYQVINCSNEEIESFDCIICDKEHYGYGNNPEPIKDSGKCCTNCNYKVVLPKRMEKLLG
tara:strand:- start:86 stop:460 length:375 start_codon:yes stop_codon:yes gene_type:complete